MSIVGSETEDITTDVAPQPEKKRGRQPYPRDAAGNIIRPDGSTSKPSGRPAKSRGSLETQIGGFLTMWNTPIRMMLPLYALDPVEIEALAKALDMQCQTSPRFRKYMESALKGIGGVSLIGVLAVIVGRRVVRADLVPIPTEAPVNKEQIDAMLGGVLSMSIAKGAINQEAVAA